jgi:hypothetical protein
MGRAAHAKYENKRAMQRKCECACCGDRGVHTPAFVVVKKSTVMQNQTGLQTVNGGSILSYQNNAFTGNVTDGTPTGAFALK